MSQERADSEAGEPQPAAEAAGPQPGASTEPGGGPGTRPGSAAHAATLDAAKSGDFPRSSAPGTTELVEGSILDSAYRVIRRIGGGAMGSVYLVEHLRLGRRFAAKVVAAAHASNLDIIARLQNEARVASSIQHENIVDVTHLGTTGDGSVFVVMELLEGNDLRHRLDQQTPEVPWLPEDEVQRIVRDVLTGLHAAHEVGVVHRDLKPDNVFLAKKGARVRAKIVDFGISKLQSTEADMRLTRTGQIMGTPLYMAPEQTRGTSDVDRRADVYAMGVILYELVTGRLPFEAHSIYELIVKHATETPASPRTHRPDLPTSVATVIMRCLEKRPDARFQTADQLLSAWDDAWEARDEAEPEIGETEAEVREAEPENLDAPREQAPTAPRATRAALPWMIGVGVAAMTVLGLVMFAVNGSGDEPSTIARPPHVATPHVATPPVVIAPHVPAVPVTPPVPTTPTGVPLVDPTLPLGIDAAPDVTREIVSDPAGAEVWIAGERVGTTPFTLVLPAGAPTTVQLRATGYRSLTRTVTRDGPDAISLALDRAPRGHTTSGLPTLAPH